MARLRRDHRARIDGDNTPRIGHDNRRRIGREDRPPIGRDNRARLGGEDISGLGRENTALFWRGATGWRDVRELPTRADALVAYWRAALVAQRAAPTRLMYVRAAASIARRPCAEGYLDIDARCCGWLDDA